MKRSALTLIVLGVITVAIGAAGASEWSLIPVGLHARVASTGWSDNGPPFKVLNLVGGRQLTIDTRLFQRMGGEGIKGRLVEKERGDRAVTVNGRTISLTVSSQFWKVAATLTAVVAFALWRHLRRRRALLSQTPAPRVATASS